MAQVPTSGNIEMFDSANSIYEVIMSEFSPSSLPKTFDDILDYVKNNCIIEQFHATYRPASIDDVNQSQHFRGFPTSKLIVLGYQGNTVAEACQNGGLEFYLGTYTGTLAVSSSLGVSVSGSLGYFKVLVAGDNYLAGDVIGVNSSNIITSISDNPCGAHNIVHICEDRIEMYM